MTDTTLRTPSEDAWEAFLKSLFSPLPGLREMAILELPTWHAHGRNVTPLLEMSVRDPEPMVCRAAAIVAGRMRIATPALLDELEKKLTAADDLLKRTIVTTFARLGAAGLPRMIRLLADRDPFVRRFVALALEDLGEPAIAPLIAALAQEPLRRAAAEVLIGIGQPALPQVMKLLDQPDRDLQYVAMDILEGIGPHVLPTLIEEIKLGNRGPAVGGDAVTRFGPDAIPELMKALRSSDAAHQCWAAATLVKIGPAAVPALTASIGTDSTSVCWLAAKALAQIGTAAVPNLLTILANPNATVRWVAADILAQIGGDALPSLERIITEGEAPAREAAIHALGLMGETASSSLPTLTAALQRESDPSLRQALQETIAKLAVFQ